MKSKNIMFKSSCFSNTMSSKNGTCGKVFQKVNKLFCEIANSKEYLSFVSYMNITKTFIHSGIILRDLFEHDGVHLNKDDAKKFAVQLKNMS